MPMHSDQQASRQVPDQRVKVAEYRFYRIMGKGLLFLMLSISTPMVFGLNQASGFSMWWLFVIPVLLLVGLFWKGFPAFCRCPGCSKRMVSRSRAGKLTHPEKSSREIQPTRHYLVCDHCMLHLFLGETGDGD